jgi:hypothetical protein
MYIESKCSYCQKPVTRKQQSISANVKLHFCDNTCKALYQKLAKPVTKEWLVEHYINQHMDTSQIGRLVDRDPKSVWNWLKDFGIPTRGRGFASTKPFKKGESWWTGKTHPPEFSEKLRQVRLQDGHYPKQKNGQPYWKGKRGEIMPSWHGGHTPERQSAYNTDEWKLAVKIVWTRDNAICQRCGLDHRIINREEIYFAIHHIISFRYKEFRFNPDCLVLICVKCHRFIHSKNNIDREWLSE